MTARNYHTFTLEDFLTDDFFKASVKNPTRESIAFWKSFTDSNPPNISDYCVAKKYIESSGRVLPVITDREVAQLWRNIAAETGLDKPEPLIRRKYIRYSIAVAASLMLFFALWPVFNAPPRDGIYEYAHATADSLDRQQAQLILSDAKTVIITDNTSEITYDESKITVSREEISKEESASYNQLIIPKGKMSKLTLADGTKVWINANTRIVYPVEFTGNRREIYVDGEIFLDVVHDSRPFIVKTKGLNVEVLGTRFNVCAYDKQELQRIVLVEGSVEISDNEGRNKARLEPEQMYESAAAGQSCVKKVDVRKYASWIDGLYYFDKERLETVVHRLSDYYGVRIVCGGKAGDFTCSGKLDLKEDLEEVLRGLARSMPVSYECVGDDMYVILVKDR